MAGGNEQKRLESELAALIISVHEEHPGWGIAEIAVAADVPVTMAAAVIREYKGHLRAASVGYSEEKAKEEAKVAVANNVARHCLNVIQTFLVVSAAPAAQHLEPDVCEGISQGWGGRVSADLIAELQNAVEIGGKAMNPGLEIIKQHANRRNPYEWAAAASYHEATLYIARELFRHVQFNNWDHGYDGLEVWVRHEFRHRKMNLAYFHTCLGDELTGALAALKMPKESRTPDKPRWDSDACVLTFRGKEARKIRPIAKDAITILAAFEEDDWVHRVDNPLGPERDLREAVKTLNTGITGLRFGGDGTGKGIVWRET